MFAVLEHTTSAGVHWDLLMEAPGQEPLLTWRLAHNPLAARGPIPAQRLPDHRPAYLDYEGPLTGDRGKVRRLDRGPSRLVALNASVCEFELDGERLRGRFCIRNPDGSGELQSSPCAE